MIDGDRVILSVQSRPPQVSYLRDGKFSIDGSGQDCVRAGSHAAIASGGGKYSCGNVVEFEFQPDETVFVSGRGTRSKGRYEIYDDDVLIYANQNLVTLKFANGVLGSGGHGDCVKSQ